MLTGYAVWKLRTWFWCVCGCWTIAFLTVLWLILLWVTLCGVILLWVTLCVMKFLAPFWYLVQYILGLALNTYFFWVLDSTFFAIINSAWSQQSCPLFVDIGFFHFIRILSHHVVWNLLFWRIFYEILRTWKIPLFKVFL